MLWDAPSYLTLTSESLLKQIPIVKGVSGNQRMIFCFFSVETTESAKGFSKGSAEIPCRKMFEQNLKLMKHYLT